MYKPSAGLVNSEIIGALLDLCNDQFLKPFKREGLEYDFRCIYCGATLLDKNKADHSASCPTVKYKDIVKKHNRIIVEK